MLSKLSGAALTSSELLTEAGGGAAAYLTKDVSESLIDKGLTKLGASKEVVTDTGIIGSDALAGLAYGSISGGLPGAGLGFIGGAVVGTGELLEKKANLDLSAVGKDAAVAGAAGLALGPEFVPIAAAGGALFGVGKAIFDKFT